MLALLGSVYGVLESMVKNLLDRSSITYDELLSLPIIHKKKYASPLVEPLPMHQDTRAYSMARITVGSFVISTSFVTLVQRHGEC